MFGKNLKKLIIDKGLTLREVADRADIGYNVILSYVDSRQVLPNVVYGHRIAQSLNTTVERLISGRNPQKCETCYYFDVVHDLAQLSAENYRVVSALIKFLLSAENPENNSDKIL